MDNPTPQPVPPPVENISRSLVVVVVVVLIALSTVLTQAGRVRLFAWAAMVQSAFQTPPVDSLFVSRPSGLTPEQARAAHWIAKRYRVAQGAVEQIVGHAFEAAELFRLDPYLVLAVIAIESRFNPLAESSAGAKGLMQIMAKVHMEKFQALGGGDLVLTPWANIRVGATILREYLDRYRNLDSALRAYVGVGPSGVTEYPEKVLRERSRIVAAAQGRVLNASGD
jgi:soluble lytic murein transglycosylase-like protein